MGYDESLNLYQYVRNDPLNNTDPTGREIRFGTDDIGFIVDVALDLAKLMSEPGGAALVRELHASEHVITIVPGTQNTTVFQSQEGSNDGTGTGATVYFNPDQTRGNRDVEGNAQRPSFVGLGHELGHSRDAVRGEDDPQNPETSAVRTENVIRREHGLPQVPPPRQSGSTTQRPEVRNDQGQGQRQTERVCQTGSRICR
ncbi:MAG: hypothetical protein JNM59_04360 [Hyphomonadaceae bacterium]|nr:hypothetical protein [Hyphomonadaceae bacterium]